MLFGRLVQLFFVCRAFPRTFWRKTQERQKNEKATLAFFGKKYYDNKKVKDSQTHSGCAPPAREERSSVEYKDYYATLGVEKTASQDEIKKAYRKLAKKHHPDVNKGNSASEAKFKDIGEAYEVLGDEAKRKKYDAFGNQTQFAGGNDFDPSQYGFNGSTRYQYAGSADRSDFFNMFFSDAFNDLFGGAQTGGRTSRVYQSGDLDGLFGHAGGGARRARAGGDIEAQISITVEEGAAGGEKRISLQTQEGTRGLNFKLPAGVRDGETIRLKGQGYAGTGGGKAGDLRMTVRMEKSARFALEGEKLITTADVFPWDAALGVKLPVDTLDGRIMVSLPAGVQTGSRIRVAGKGYPFRGKPRGDLMIDVRIKNPAALSGEQRKLYEKLRALK